MDVLSLLSLLQNERLHFTKLRDLCRFDVNEGTGGLSIETRGIIAPPLSLPQDSESDARVYEKIAKTEKELKTPLISALPKSRKQVKAWDGQNENVFISCWHENEIESDFMWRIYAKQEYGFAVVSAVEKLVESFKGLDRTKIGFGFVVYPSRDVLIHDDLHSWMGSDSAFMIKHPEFSSENEFRVFVCTRTPFQNVDLEIDLQKLIQEIRISPLVPDWAAAALLKTINPICKRKGIPRIQPRPLRLRT